MRECVAESFDELAQEVARALRTTRIFAHQIGSVWALFEHAKAVTADADACDGVVAVEIGEAAFLDGLCGIIFEFDEVGKTPTNGDAVDVEAFERGENRRNGGLHGLVMGDGIECVDFLGFCIVDGVFYCFGTDINACVFHGIDLFIL